MELYEYNYEYKDNTEEPTITGSVISSSLASATMLAANEVKNELPELGMFKTKHLTMFNETKTECN